MPSVPVFWLFLDLSFRVDYLQGFDLYCVSHHNITHCSIPLYYRGRLLPLIVENGILLMCRFGSQFVNQEAYTHKEKYD